MFTKFLIAAVLLGGCTIQPYRYVAAPQPVVYQQSVEPIYVPERRTHVVRVYHQPHPHRYSRRYRREAFR